MSISNMVNSKVNQKEIISVFCNPEDNYSTVVGFVAAADENHFVLKHVTVAGRYDGYMLRQKDQIFRIDEKTSYEKNLLKLYLYYHEKHIDFDTADEVLVAFLSFAMKQNFIVGIGIKDFETSSIFGFIDNINEGDKTVVVHQINDDGFFDGYSTVSFDAIVRMSCDGEKEQTFKVLNSMV